MLLWSTHYIASKLLLSHHYSPEGIVLYRILFATITLGGFYFFKRKPLSLNPTDWLLLLVASVCGVLASNILLVYGIQYAGAGIASIVMNTNPFFITVVAALLGMEKFSFTKLVGIVVGVGGVSMVALHDAHIGELLQNVEFKGMIYTVLASLGAAILTLIGKRLTPKMGGLAYTFYTFIPSGVIIMILNLVTAPEKFVIRSLPDFLTFFYLGAIATACTWWIFAASLKHLDAGHTASYKLLIPLYAAVLAYIIFGETLNILAYCGMIVISIGVYIVSSHTIISSFFHSYESRTKTVR